MSQRLSHKDLGKPDLKVAGFQLWMHGRQFAEADDYYDGNWLRVTAHCDASGASVWAQGAIERCTLSDVHDAGSLLKAHSHRLTELLSAKIPRRIRSLDDLIGAQKLFSELECQYRRDVGYLTFEEANTMSERTQGRSFLPGSLRFFHWVFMRRVQKHKSGMVVV